MRGQMRHRTRERGLTLLELMIVVAIIGVALLALRSSLRVLTNFGLSQDADELAAMLRRASQLAVERGEQHRVVFDLEKGVYRIDVCQGLAGLSRNEQVDPDKEEVEQAVQKGQEKLRDLPQDALAAGDPEEALVRAKAIAGHHVGDRTCTPAQGGISGVRHDPNKRYIQVGEDNADWIRNLNVASGVKFEEIWVQHKEGSTKKGEVAIYFFANGSAEKAVLLLSDPDEHYRSVMVHGLTGRIEQKSGKLDDVDAHMLRNVMGDKDQEREVDR
jgi:prepilin-type N-terminal cleavage/methylation domain-containing protein